MSVEVRSCRKGQGTTTQEIGDRRVAAIGIPREGLPWDEVKKLPESVQLQKIVGDALDVESNVIRELSLCDLGVAFPACLREFCGGRNAGWRRYRQACPTYHRQVATLDGKQEPIAKLRIQYSVSCWWHSIAFVGVGAAEPPQMGRGARRSSAVRPGGRTAEHRSEGNRRRHTLSAPAGPAGSGTSPGSPAPPGRPRRATRHPRRRWRRRRGPSSRRPDRRSVHPPRGCGSPADTGRA